VRERGVERVNTAENRRDPSPGFYRFSRGQLVVLAAGFLLSSVVIFSLGIVVGQRIEERKLVQKEGPLAKIPVQPLSKTAQRAGASGREDITFYDVIAKPPGSEPADPAKENSAGGDKPSGEQGAADRSDDKPAPPPEKISAPAPWTVQVNAFRQEADARNLGQKLTQKGYDAYVVPAEVRDRIWYRVRVGRFATREEARVLQEELKSKEKLAGARAVSR
jgi:cell division septation protein DedD